MNRRRGWLFGLVLGGLGTWLVYRRVSDPDRMPRRAAVQRELLKLKGDEAAGQLTAAAQEIYRDLYKARSRFLSPAVNIHVTSNMLPALALYRALLDAGDSQEEALGVVDTILEAETRRLVRIVRLVKYFPEPFKVFGFLQRWVARIGFPPEGWDIRYLQDDNQRVAYNIRRCVYVDVLTRFGAPELAPLFCKSDDRMFASMPESIRWQRTGTMANGAEYCDFRWDNLEGEIPLEE